MAEVETGHNGTGTALFLRVLGPTTLERAGVPVAIGGPRQRAVIARLAHADGRLVVVERLVEDLWGVDAPSSILTTLQGYVSRLRRRSTSPSACAVKAPGTSWSWTPAKWTPEPSKLM